MSTAPPRTFSLRTQLWLLLGGVLVLLWTAVAWQYRSVEADTLHEAEIHTADMALAFAEHTRASIKHIDLTLLQLRDDWLRRPEDFADAIRRRQGLLVDLAFQVGIIDADGYLAFSNLARPVERTYLGDREHFKVHKDRGDDRIFVSKPLKGRVSGRWTIQVTRPVFDRGRFAGVIVVSVDPAYFARFYEKVHLGALGITLMARDSGDVMARTPDLEKHLGKTITGTPYLGPDAKLAGNFRRVAQIDGRERIYGFRRLPDYGVTLVVGLATDETLEPSRLLQRWSLMIAGAVTLVLLGMGLLILRNLTAREHAEVRLRASEADLKRSNADLEQFAYAISHDMRQPLRMVASYMQLLEAELKDKLDDDQKGYVAFATDGARRMDAMIVALLDYSRIGRKTEPIGQVDSRAALDEALDFLAPEITACNAMVVASGEWPTVRASRDELTRLFQNLVGNAVKYRFPDRAPQVTVAAMVRGNRWRVEVRDDGIGIDPGQVDRLFKVFSRLQSRSRYDGSGIGLSLCRKVVEHHGGDIGVESAGEGHGSLFWFELPHTPADGARSAETAGATQ